MYGPSSFMVDDYTAERERERGGEREREKFLYVFPITCGPTTQREREVLCEKIKF